MKLAALAIAAMMLTACTTTDVKVAPADQITKLDSGAKGLLVQPDVQLNVLTAAGLQEPRQDWSRSAQANLASSLGAGLKAKSHSFTVLDPATSMEGRTGQLLRLHEAVGQSIQTFEYGAVKLPTKKGRFDWTLGDGATVIGAATSADYALFVTARGSYASAGRKAVMVGAALFGVAVPLGVQQVYASLVDLKTGRVVWFNSAIAGPNADVRTQEGAEVLVTSLLKGLPL